jgi:glutaminyl-tRNA synthetase
VEVRLYDRLFSVEEPDAVADFRDALNPSSLRRVAGMVEASVADDDPSTRYQFERLGFFWRDPEDSKPDALVFNRVVTLKDSWAKAVQAQDRGASDEHLRQEARRKERDRIKAQQVELAKSRTLELGARALDYKNRLGLPDEQAHVLGAQAELGDFFDQTVEHHDAARSVAGWVVTDVARVAKEAGVSGLRFGPLELAGLVRMVDEGTISSSAAKAVFETMVSTGDSPETIVEAKGLSKMSDSQLEQIVDAVIEKFSDKVEAYRAGNERLLGLFIGQVMQRSGGRADPKQVSALLRRRLHD